MREIKFRCWDEQIKGYREIDSIDFCNGEADIITTVNDGGTDLQIIFAEVGNLEQFTGLVDKNGKEIYEGDIVKSLNEKIEVVRFALDDEVGSCGCCYDAFYGSGFIISHYSCAKNCEVIGNIHENPELFGSGDE